MRSNLSHTLINYCITERPELLHRLALNYNLNNINSAQLLKTLDKHFDNNIFFETLIEIFKNVMVDRKMPKKIKLSEKLIDYLYSNFFFVSQYGIDESLLKETKVSYDNLKSSFIRANNEKLTYIYKYHMEHLIKMNDKFFDYSVQEKIIAGIFYLDYDRLKKIDTLKIKSHLWDDLLFNNKIRHMFTANDDLFQEYTRLLSPLLTNNIIAKSIFINDYINKLDSITSDKKIAFCDFLLIDKRINSNHISFAFRRDSINDFIRYKQIIDFSDELLEKLYNYVIYKCSDELFEYIINDITNSKYKININYGFIRENGTSINKLTLLFNSGAYRYDLEGLIKKCYDIDIRYKFVNFTNCFLIDKYIILEYINQEIQHLKVILKNRKDVVNSNNIQVHLKSYNIMMLTDGMGNLKYSSGENYKYTLTCYETFEEIYFELIQKYKRSVTKSALK